MNIQLQQDPVSGYLYDANGNAYDPRNNQYTGYTIQQVRYMQQQQAQPQNNNNNNNPSAFANTQPQQIMMQPNQNNGGQNMDHGTSHRFSGKEDTTSGQPTQKILVPKETTPKDIVEDDYDHMPGHEFPPLLPYYEKYKPVIKHGMLMYSTVKETEEGERSLLDYDKHLAIYGESYKHDVMSVAIGGDIEVDDPVVIDKTIIVRSYNELMTNIQLEHFGVHKDNKILKANAVLNKEYVTSFIGSEEDTATFIVNAFEKSSTVLDASNALRSALTSKNGARIKERIDTDLTDYFYVLARMQGGSGFTLGSFINELQILIKGLAELEIDDQKKYTSIFKSTYLKMKQAIIKGSESFKTVRKKGDAIVVNLPIAFNVISIMDTLVTTEIRKAYIKTDKNDDIVKHKTILSITVENTPFVHTVIANNYDFKQLNFLLVENRLYFVSNISGESRFAIKAM